MKDLERKYRHDTLTSAELIELRQKVNASTDHELEQGMLDAWNEGDFNTHQQTDNSTLQLIKKNIDRALWPTRWRATLWKCYTGIAGCLLLPIFIALTISLHRTNTQLYNHDITFSTGKGERAAVVLPDGSKAMLNSMSELSYTLGDYNNERRNVKFDGEGYFEVTRDPHAPFTIASHNLKVEVLGTTFNLLARNDGETAELWLEKGCVLLVSLSKGDSAILNSNEKAILDQSTGSITVVKEPNITMASAWTRGELIYRNTKLREVLRDIETCYNISIKTDCDEDLDNTFTGTLSTHNLNEALEIIELSYNLKAYIDNKNVSLIKN